MNRSKYCITHKRNCVASTSSSSWRRRGNPSKELDSETEPESEDSKDETPDAYAEETQQTQLKDVAHKTLEHKQDQTARPGMLIADHYVPIHITKHRIVRGGGTAAQMQFLVEWLPARL